MRPSTRRAWYPPRPRVRARPSLCTVQGAHAISPRTQGLVVQVEATVVMRELPAAQLREETQGGLSRHALRHGGQKQVSPLLERLQQRSGRRRKRRRGRRKMVSLRTPATGPSASITACTCSGERDHSEASGPAQLDRAARACEYSWNAHSIVSNLCCSSSRVRAVAGEADRSGHNATAASAIRTEFTAIYKAWRNRDFGDDALALTSANSSQSAAMCCNRAALWHIAAARARRVSCLLPPRQTRKLKAQRLLHRRRPAVHPKLGRLLAGQKALTVVPGRVRARPGRSRSLRSRRPRPPCIFGLRPQLAGLEIGLVPDVPKSQRKSIVALPKTSGRMTALRLCAACGRALSKRLASLLERGGGARRKTRPGRTPQARPCLGCAGPLPVSSAPDLYPLLSVRGLW